MYFQQYIKYVTTMWFVYVLKGVIFIMEAGVSAFCKCASVCSQVLLQAMQIVIMRDLNDFALEF